MIHTIHQPGTWELKLPLSRRLFHIGSVIALFVLICTSARAQVNNAEFEDRISQIFDMDLSEPALIDSSVRQLIELNNTLGSRHDSLVAELLIWDCKRNLRSLGASERLPYLRARSESISQYATSYPEVQAQVHIMFIDLFRRAFEIDSIDIQLNYIEQAIAKVPDPSEVRLRCIYERARLAYDRSDFDASLTFLLNARAYIEQYLPDNVQRKIYVLNAIGIGYRRTGQPRKAIEHYEEVLQFIDDQDLATYYGMVLNNMGLAQMDAGEYEQAINYMSEGIRSNREYRSENHHEIGTGYDNIALCYMRLGESENALLYSQRSVDFITKFLGEYHADLLVPLSTQFQLYLNAENWIEAKRINARAIDLMLNLGWKPDDPGGALLIEDVFQILHLSVALQRRLYDETKDIDALKLAASYAQDFVATADYTYDNLRSSLSKDIFHNKYAGDFSQFIDNLFELYALTNNDKYLNEAFIYSEKFKSLELYYAAQEDKAEEIPLFKELTQERETLQDSISYFEQILGEDDLDDSERIDATKSLNQAKEKIYSWQQQARKQYPNYYDLIYHPTPIPIDTFGHYASRDSQVLLSYHLAGESIYTFLIDGQNNAFFRTPIDKNLSNEITQFRQAIFGFFTGSDQSESQYLRLADEYVDFGVSLYDLLLSNIESQLTSRVVIIAQGELAYLPFGALLMRRPEVSHHFKLHPYLINKYAISYSPSARQWLENTRALSAKNQRFLAMAPQYSESTDNLPYAISEAEQAARVMSGKAITGQQATKAQFVGLSDSYSVIHLAMHGKADNESGDRSFLTFSDIHDDDNLLYANEIYPLALDCDLVTLSACETGLGQLRTKEGVISLARAFSFAGSKAILSSLWVVSDKSTRDVVNSFYTNLNSNTRKDMALQKAKIDFINSRGHIDAHPFFWGGFVQYGSAQSIGERSQPLNTSFLVMASLAIVLFLLLFIRRRKMHTQ